MSRPYRSNVGIAVINSSGKVLAGERLMYPGIYQYPQGGIDEGEDPLAAARRELYEETGLQIDENPVAVTEDWLYYDFPEDVPEKLKKYRGQKQKWFFFRWDGDIASLNTDLHEKEFLSLAWKDPSELTEGIIYFKKDVYRIIEKIVREINSGKR